MTDKQMMTREEMLDWLDGAENDVYDYASEGRMLDAIRAAISECFRLREKVGEWKKTLNRDHISWADTLNVLNEIRDFGGEEGQ